MQDGVIAHKISIKLNKVCCCCCKLSFTSVSKRVLSETIQMKMCLICMKSEHASKTHFQMKGFAPGLVLNVKSEMIAWYANILILLLNAETCFTSNDNDITI